MPSSRLAASGHLLVPCGLPAIPLAARRTRRRSTRNALNRSSASPQWRMRAHAILRTGDGLPRSSRAREITVPSKGGVPMAAEAATKETACAVIGAGLGGVAVCANLALAGYRMRLHDVDG